MNVKISAADLLAQLRSNGKYAAESTAAVAEPPTDNPANNFVENRLSQLVTTFASAGPSQADEPPALGSGKPSGITEVYQRASSILTAATDRTESRNFLPKTPQTIQETGLTEEEIERLILKYMLAKGSATGRIISQQVKLTFGIVDSIMRQMKNDRMVAHKGSATMGDYEYVITDAGRDRARRFNAEGTYFGAAPVVLKDYVEGIAAQSIANQRACEPDLRRAFRDLLINPNLLDRLGPAVNSGRGMFLYGAPGNGKTSIAERVTTSFGSKIWIPRCLGIDGEIIRLFDPSVHAEVRVENEGGLLDVTGIDQRWVQIERPTVVAGGELTMAELEVSQNSHTKICEAPLQLKSNCGTLVIDDFGRQKMPVDQLLNRWIVPLEKRYDFLNLPSGKKIQVPFDQLIIFSTNLEPKDLVDGAFLRRIPYKIEVPDLNEQEFRTLFQIMCPKMGFEYDEKQIRYLIDTHYKPSDRPLRACHPRDLLLQIKNYCNYKQVTPVLAPEYFDRAVLNYFAVM